MSAKIIPFHNVVEERKCSFCKAKEQDVKTLFKSGYTNHCICGDCAKQAMLRLKEEEIL